MVLATIETPQLLFDMMVNAPVMQVVLVPGFQLPCRGAEADPHGPDCSADHRDFEVAVHGYRSPVVLSSSFLPVVAQWGSSLGPDC